MKVTKRSVYTEGKPKLAKSKPGIILMHYEEDWSTEEQELNTFKQMAPKYDFLNLGKQKQ